MDYDPSRNYYRSKSADRAPFERKPLKTYNEKE